MKKLYTVLVASMMALAANAAVYITGAMTNPQWNASQAETMTVGTDGNYTYTYTSNGEAQGFKLSTVKADWDSGFNANGMYCKPENGKYVDLQKNNSGDIITPVYKSGTPVTITIKSDLSQLKIDGTLSNAPVVVKFFGNLNGGSWTEYDLTNGSYKLNVTSTCYFTFTTGGWGGAWRPVDGSQNCEVAKNGSYQATGSNDKVFVISKVGSYVITPNAADKTFTVTGFPDEPITTTLKFFANLEPSVTDDWTAYDLVDGSYTFEVKTGGCYFTFTTDGNWSGAWRPKSGSNEEINDNGTYQAQSYGNDGVFTIVTPGTYTVTPDAASTSFSITGFSSNVEYPEALYILGYINGQDFGTLTGMKDTTAEDGVYTWEKALMGDAGAGKGYFNIASVVDTEGTGNWDASVNSGDRYGAPTKDTPLTPDAPAAVAVYKANVNASACQSWEIEPGVYNVTLNLNDMTISVQKTTSGIEDVEYVGGAAPAYYNLQGVRVMNPENGIFIEVRAGKAVKVVK